MSAVQFCTKLCCCALAWSKRLLDYCAQCRCQLCAMLRMRQCCVTSFYASLVRSLLLGLRPLLGGSACSGLCKITPSGRCCFAMRLDISRMPLQKCLFIFCVAVCVPGSCCMVSCRCVLSLAMWLQAMGTNVSHRQKAFVCGAFCCMCPGKSSLARVHWQEFTGKSELHNSLNTV